MSFFNQRRDTIEWAEYRDDVLFFKWGNNELKGGSTLVVRTGQKAIFYYNGAIDGIFETPGSYDIDTQIVPFLTTIKSIFELKKDSGIRTDIYFVNAKELTMSWGTRERIMIPTAEVPSGIPVGMNGNLVVEFRDYQKFIEKVAGVKPTYTLDDIGERIRGELDGIVSESILNGQ
ncbi:MAG: SPFH domain-containing protein, partial [Oscillospiraceae bacterium]|nr:SPFH domain-containing protein [Oscillospiraceae bacterium]